MKKIRVDEKRNDRIAKLEKLRRGEEEIEDHEDDAPDPENSRSIPGASALPESAESSVEGLRLDGAKRHPFKVIEPDRRSVCSESRSSHGRTSQTKSYDHSTRGDSIPKCHHEVQ